MGKFINAKINNVTVNEITYTIINNASDLLLIRNDGSLDYADVYTAPHHYIKHIGYRLY
jgi:hypothetical protein